ncbi:flagellar basal body protein [Candidatus Raskinella chloraquaticus]|jgi:flagellar basal-body rod protein FlgB|uniref:Flagellar basal body rod protein FlgB n=1 Tax=Candidatus Raskinella chloraquaticus TaxID=1951219 RepID=A0A1W9I1E5_9HYPH|nr:MAG: hypothetical protein A4S15_04875 [Proteobacteria bacterium SG_bin8]
MAVNETSLLSMLKTKMHWHNERQNILAENVANSDTPRFKARDLKTLTFEVPQALAPQRTNGQHLASFGPGVSGGEATKASVFETRPSGNAVVLEDEMLKLGQNQADYQAAATLYQKGIGLLRTAIGRR